MVKLFMTSSPMGAYRSTKAPSFKGLNPANGMVEELKSYWREDSRCLLISAFPDEFDLNDGMRKDFERIFRETGLSVKCMDLCDRRGGRESEAGMCRRSKRFLTRSDCGKPFKDGTES